MGIAKSTLHIVENILSKPQETLEFKMNKQKGSFSFDVPLELQEQWMMGVTSLEVYNTVYNITEKNNKFQIQLTNEQIKHFGLYPQLVTTIEYLTKTYNMKEEKSFKDFKKQISCVKRRK